MTGKANLAASVAARLLGRPPTQFGMIGEVIIAFLGPVRDSIMAGESFDAHWPIGGPWSPRVPAGEPRS